MISSLRQWQLGSATVLYRMLDILAETKVHINIGHGMVYLAHFLTILLHFCLNLGHFGHKSTQFDRVTFPALLQLGAM